MHPYVWADDPILREFVREAAADPDTLGLFLSGSRGAGLAADDSDYDLWRVLGDAAYALRHERGLPAGEKLQAIGGRPLVELSFTCPRRLAEVAAAPGWWTFGYADSTVLLDKTGAVAAALRAIATPPADRARAAAAGWFDSYLNALYRSLKAWRRGDELGWRLQAADSATALVRTLFALEGRWPPYHDRLARHLHALASQGWPSGYLHETVLTILRTGDPAAQVELAGRVEALLRARGHGHVLDAWGGEIERVTADHAGA